MSCSVSVEEQSRLLEPY